MGRPQFEVPGASTSVVSSGGSSVPPASDDFTHTGASGASPGNISDTIAVPDRASDLALRDDNADASFTVTVEFDNTSVSYSGDGTTPVDEVRSVVGPSATVTISGAATTCDYDIYAR